MTSVCVAVCSERPSGARGACLAALAREGVEPVVVGPGHEPPGTASARNAALAACAAEVIAFVDDDVLVPEGWLARLTAAWATAPDDRGAIGGPLVLEGAPAWVDERLAAAYGALDLGDEPLVLDPARRTLFAGNLSFRTGALRGAGGFWPVRGRPGARDWFTEEHHAQRELGRGGWTLAYEPALRAARRAEPGAGLVDLARRRLAYGARNQLVGEPVARGAARRAAASAAAGAALARSRAVRAQRVARAAQALGALLAERIAHADLQPVAPSTPFAASVPEAQARAGRRVRRRREPAPTILLYHRIADEPGADRLGLAVSPANFAAQLELLGERIVSLEAVAAGQAPPGSVALTFDDGYADNLAALRGAGVPATVFVSTGHVEQGRSFWWDELERLLRAARSGEPLVVDLDGDVRAWREPTAALPALNAMLQTLAPERGERVLAQVRAWAGAPPGADPRPLTLDELRELAGVATIGAHTRDHANLRWAGEAAAREQIERSRDDLTRWLGAPPTAFSYPFGVPGRDLDETTTALVRAAGFEIAVMNAPRPTEPGADPLALPRRFAPDLGADGLAPWLDGVTGR